MNTLPDDLAITARVWVMGMPADSEIAMDRLMRDSVASYMSLPMTGTRNFARSHFMRPSAVVSQRRTP